MGPSRSGLRVDFTSLLESGGVASPSGHPGERSLRSQSLCEGKEGGKGSSCGFRARRLVRHTCTATRTGNLEIRVAGSLITEVQSEVWLLSVTLCAKTGA